MPRASVQSRGNSLQKPDVAFHEIEGSELVARLPPHLLENHVARFAFELGYAKEDQPDKMLSRVDVLIARDFLAGDAMNVQLFGEFALERLRQRFAAFHFPTRELPFQRMGLPRFTLADEDPAFPLDDPRNDLQHPDRK